MRTCFLTLLAIASMLISQDEPSRRLDEAAAGFSEINTARSWESRKGKRYASTSWL